jgi:hypothetical protein
MKNQRNSLWNLGLAHGPVRELTETQGASVAVGGGTVDQGFGTPQYGGKAGNTSFPGFVKYVNHDHFFNSNGRDGGDGWSISRTGFRADTDLSPKDTLTLEGDLYRGREGSPAKGIDTVVTPLIPEKEVDPGGGFIQGVWNHATSSRAGTTLEAAFDEYERNDYLGETREPADIATNLKIAKRWTLSPGDAFEQVHMHVEPSSQDTSAASEAEGSSPVHSAQLRSHLSLPHRMFRDAPAHFSGRLKDPAVSSYARFDSGRTWQWNSKVDISSLGQNLLKDYHQEFVDGTGSAGTDQAQCVHAVEMELLTCMRPA